MFHVLAFKDLLLPTLHLQQRRVSGFAHVEIQRSLSTITKGHLRVVDLLPCWLNKVIRFPVERHRFGFGVHFYLKSCAALVRTGHGQNGKFRLRWGRILRVMVGTTSQRERGNYSIYRFHIDYPLLL